MKHRPLRKRQNNPEIITMLSTCIMLSVYKVLHVFYLFVNLSIVLSTIIIHIFSVVQMKGAETEWRYVSEWWR